jgi:hypothetical protein
LFDGGTVVDQHDYLPVPREDVAGDVVDITALRPETSRPVICPLPMW